jgi:hypothetical protein
MIGNSWTSAEMFLGWTFGWKWFPFIYGGRCLRFSIAWISPQWSYCWLIIYASLYGMRKENVGYILSSRFFPGFPRVFPALCWCEWPGFHQIRNYGVQSISISKIEVNVFSFIHQETGIIHNNLLSLADFTWLLMELLANIIYASIYGLRKEFLYLVFYVFPGYFRFFTFCVMTGFH